VTEWIKNLGRNQAQWEGLVIFWATNEHSVIMALIAPGIKVSFGPSDHKWTMLRCKRGLKYFELIHFQLLLEVVKSAFHRIAFVVLTLAFEQP